MRRHAVFVHKISGLLAHHIGTCVADEDARDASPSHADDTVEAAAAWHGCYRLIMFKENIQNGLSDSNYLFSHDKK